MNTKPLIQKVVGSVAVAACLSLGLTTVTTAPNAAPPVVDAGSLTLVAATSYPTLKYGNTGVNVVALQYLLKFEGYTLQADGSFGDITRGAVSAFQKRMGLSRTDGVADHATISKAIDTVRYGDYDFAAAAAQTLLRKHGYYSGTIDGSFGDNSRAASIAFQRAKGIGDGTGTVGGATWLELFAPKSTTTTPLRDKIMTAAFKYEGQTGATYCSTRDCYDPAWCQDYVWYTWREAGVSVSQSLIDRHQVASFLDYNTANHKYSLGSAKKGDAIVWYGNGAKHVGIITARNADGTVNIIHGNWGLNGGPYNKVYHQKSSNGTLGGVKFTAIVPPVGG